jgi:hypothetical protein
LLNAQHHRQILLLLLLLLSPKASHSNNFKTLGTNPNTKPVTTLHAWPWKSTCKYYLNTFS